MKLPKFNLHAEKYVNDDGTPYVSDKDPVKTLRAVGIFLLVVFIIIIIYFFVRSITRNNRCYNIESKILDAGFNYAKQKKVLPVINGEKVTIKLNEFSKKVDLPDSELTIDDEKCDAEVTYTKYNNTYVKSINLKGCGYCASNKRYTKKTGSTSKYDPRKHNVKVVTTYNYYTRESYYTEYTDYMESAKVKKKESKKYHVYLPKDKNELPDTPEDAHVVAIEQEVMKYYRYRDKQWLFYEKNNPNYSAYSSEKPKGYAYKDEESVKNSKLSKWTLNYPDEKEYRTIEATVAYRWYYKKGRKKIYYNNGAYTIDPPSKKYKRYDKTANMYRYYDEQWRWYNGQERDYCGYDSTPSEYCTHKDEDTLDHTEWSGWEPDSYLNPSNASYREQQEDIYSRYRIKYEIHSFPIMKNYVDKKEIEAKIGKPIADIVSDEHIGLQYDYKFIYGK